MSLEGQDLLRQCYDTTPKGLRAAAKKGQVLRPVPFKFTARLDDDAGGGGGGGGEEEDSDEDGEGKRGSSLGRAMAGKVAGKVAKIGGKLARRAVLKAVGLGEDAEVTVHRGRCIIVQCVLDA